MFIDRIMLTGIAVAVGTTVLAAVALTLMVIYLLNLPVPQVVRLVALVPSPGTVILEDVGATGTLSVQGYYSDQTLADLEADFITYESTDPSVVSVSPDGTVIANGAGGADIIIGFGSFTKSVHALVFGDIPELPPIDPAMVGVIPDLEEEVRAVLNRVIVELRPGYDDSDADDIAEELGGEVVFSFNSFPGHMIEFDTQQHTLTDVLSDLEGDFRLDAAYADVLLEPLDHPIDTLGPPRTAHLTRAYLDAGFERSWRMLERVPHLDPVTIWIIEKGHLDIEDEDEPAIVREEFDAKRIHIPKRLISFRLSTGDHAAAVTGVVAAKNHRGAGPNADQNFSGIVTSVPDLAYDVISLNRNPRWLNLGSVLSELEQIDRSPSAIDVANMSFGGRAISEWTNFGAMKRIIGGMSGVTFVAGAGNCEVEAIEYFPAKYSLDYDNVITVGGADADYSGRWTSQPPDCNWRGLKGNSSAYGDAVTIAAPAELVWTVDVEGPGDYTFFSGTSLAAPMVSGAVALLKAIDSDVTPEELNELLVDVADEREICTSTPAPLERCPKGDEELWSFLRADRAVAKLLSERVDARIPADGQDNLTIAVPPETRRILGNRFDFGVDVSNTGEMAWPFYGEALVRSPDGTELKLRPAENVVAPGANHRFRWGFWPTGPGCWDVRLGVWMEDPNSTSTYMIDTLGELDALGKLGPNRVTVPGQLADSGWRDNVLEVRSDPDQPEQCSGTDRTIPFDTGQISAGAKANVLLLADTSGSMEGSKSDALKEAIGIFVETMSNIRLEAKGGIDPDPDYVGLTDFDSDYREVVTVGPIDPAGADVDAWEDAAYSLDADGGTALYDAIIRSVDSLEERGDLGRKNIIIALTDGVDQDSSSSYGDVLSRLEQSSVSLFAVALSEPGVTEDYDLSVLEDLARTGRGAAYAADTGNLPGLYGFFTTMFQIEP